MAMVNGMKSSKEMDFDQFLQGVKAGAITKDMILQQEEETWEKYDTMSVPLFRRWQSYMYRTNTKPWIMIPIRYRHIICG